MEYYGEMRDSSFETTPYCMNFFSMFLSFLLLLAASCTKPSSSHEPAKPLILVSIAPYKFFTQRVAGPDFNVETVVPAGANPHIFEPTSRQVAAISKGAVWFRIGEPFEKKILPVFQEKNRAFTDFDLRNDIELIEDHHLNCSHCSMDHSDRHIWLSPKLAIKQARSIAQTLADKFPEKKDLFFENAEKLASELSELDREIASILGLMKDKTLLVSHPAFGYFCKDYGLEQLSVEYEGKDPRPRHLEAVLQKASASHTNLALALPQHNNKGAQLIAEKLHVPVRMIDPYSPDYFETLRLLAHIIADPQYQP